MEATKVLWITFLLQELGVKSNYVPKLDGKISALYIARNPFYYVRIKHIEVDYYFVRDQVLKKQLLIEHCSSSDQFGDILTKTLSSITFLSFGNKLMVLHRP